MRKFLIASNTLCVAVSVAAAVTGNPKLLGLNMSIGSLNGLVFTTMVTKEKS